MTTDGAKVMVELPEIARQRLRRAAGGEHPDAGLLTAFVEGSLARSHRGQVLNHLIACSDCNRLVALVAPEREAAPVVQPVPERRGWFAWTPLRWAGAAAAAVLIVSAVWIGRIEEPSQAPAAPSVAVAKTPTSPNMTAQLPAAPVATPAKPMPRPQQPRELAKSPSAPAQPAPVAVPDAIYAQSRPGVPGNVRDQNAFETSVMSGVNPQVPLSAGETLHAPPKPDAAPAVQPKPAAPARASGPVWSVSDSGVLQKSSDSGETWAAVPVPARSPLRALAVVGQDIWVGGDRGALYRSRDGGQSWVAVTPMAEGRTLSTDIARIAFSDAGHGWIATRSGDMWATRDGGLTWSVK